MEDLNKCKLMTDGHHITFEDQWKRIPEFKVHYIEKDILRLLTITKDSIIIIHVYYVCLDSEQSPLSPHYYRQIIFDSKTSGVYIK